jgi:hypothetical protein
VKLKLIEKPKLMLVEGDDDRQVLYEAAIYWGVYDDLHIHDCGGSSKISSTVTSLDGLTGWSMVKSLVIVRDAEEDPAEAIKDTTDALKVLKVPCPDNPFEFKSDGEIRVAYGIIPGTTTVGEEGTAVYKEGALEDILIEAIEPNAKVMDCVERFLECSTQTGLEFHAIKSKFYAYLSADKKLAGCTPKRLAQRSALNWGIKAFEPIKELLLGM